MDNHVFTVETYTDSKKEDWDQFADSCDEAWFWHTSMFLDAWPYGDNISFLIKKEGEVLLAQVLFLEKKGDGKFFFFNRIFCEK